MALDDKLFDFMNDEIYKLMLDMAKECHVEGEETSIIERFSKVDKEKFFWACKEHELDGVVGYYAKTLGLDIGEEWEIEYEKQKKHLEFLKEKSIEVCTLMKQNGIHMIILKNGGIMHDIMNSAVQCPMEDIDSLVMKKDFHKAHDILLKNGFTFKFRNIYEEEKLEESYRDGSTEYFITMTNGEKIWFELSWRVVAGRWIRPDLEPDTDDFISRSYYTAGNSVRVLSPEDNLLQICIHTAKHSYVRAPGLRLHMDVDRIVTHKVIDWELFIKKVKTTRVRKSTYLSLYIPSVLFQTRVPQWVLNELRPKNTGRLISMLTIAGLLHPNSHKFSKIQFLNFQTALYDNKKDILRVIYPSKEWIKNRYICNNNWQIILRVLLRLFDLAGIRKRR